MVSPKKKAESSACGLNRQRSQEGVHTELIKLNTYQMQVLVRTTGYLQQLAAAKYDESGYRALATILCM